MSLLLKKAYAMFIADVVFVILFHVSLLKFQNGNSIELSRWLTIRHQTNQKKKKINLKCNAIITI